MSRLKKLAGVLEEYDSEYTNKYNQVTPYHILFKDHGNEIASLNVDGAIEHCFSTIEDLNEQYQEDEDFYTLSDEEKQKLRESLEDGEIDSGMDVLFVVKDFLLESEGLEVNASRLRKTRK